MLGAGGASSRPTTPTNINNNNNNQQNLLGPLLQSPINSNGVVNSGVAGASWVTPGSGLRAGRSPSPTFITTPVGGAASVRVNDYSIRENRMFESPLGSALLRYLPEISAVMYDVYGEGSLDNEERRVASFARKHDEKMSKKNGEKRKNNSNNYTGGIEEEELDGDFDENATKNTQNKKTKKKKNGTFSYDNDDDEEIQRKQEVKLAN